MDNIERRKIKRRQRSNTLRIAVAAVMLILAVFVGLSIRNVVALKMEQSRLKKENVSLKEKKAALEQEFQNMNDRNYIEEQARKQLNMVKPGEIVYIIEDKEKDEDE